MLQNFAKLYEIEEGQIIFRKSFTEESEEHKERIVIEIQDEDIIYESSMGFKSKEQRDIAWEQITEEKALVILQGMMKQFDIS